MSGAVLVLLAGDGPDDPIAWFQMRSADGVELGRGVFGAGGSGPRGTDEAILVLRATEAQLRAVDIPAKTDVQARAAAAYAFEGEVAIAAGQAFYAVGAAMAESGARLAAALDRERLRRWLERCDDAGLAPRAIFLDCTLPAVEPDQVRVCERDGYTIVAGGPAGGFAIDTPLAPAVLRAWLQRMSGARPEVQVEGAALAAVASTLAHAGLTANMVEGGDVALDLARAALKPPAYAPNLKQGEFAESSRDARISGVWATMAGLALTAVLLQVGLLVFNGWRDQRYAAEIMARTETEFRQMRPDVQRIVNLRAQVSAALNAAKQPALNAVIATSFPVIDVLQTHPDVRLDEVRHDAPGRRVSLRFSGIEPTTLDSVVADLRKTSENVDVDQMRTDQGRASILVTVVAP